MSDEEEDKPEAEAKQKKTTSRWSDAKLLASVAALIASFAGLFNSYLAYRKSKEESVARDSYKVTLLAIERLSDETAMNHEEILSLRKYLLDHIASGNVASQLDPPPPPPPVIESRPAPVVLTRGSSKPAKFPVRADRKATKEAGGSPSLPEPKASAAAASVAAMAPPAPAAPATIPAEWPAEP